MRFKGRQEQRREMRAAALTAAESLDVRFTGQELAGLQRAMLGKVVHFTDPDYQLQRQLSNWAFQDFPLFIACCQVVEDVRVCLAFVRKHKLNFVLRSGGHSTAGFSISSGVVIDVSQLDSIAVDVDKRLARAGPGALMSHLAAELTEVGLHVPVGICGDVRLGGFMQGGGYGLTSRRFGMNCDCVVEVKLMLANGKIVIANKNLNPDIFWAVRGGTGGNFGVLLHITYALCVIGRVWGFGYDWPLVTKSDHAKAGAVLHALQRSYMRGAEADTALGYQLFMGWQNRAPALMLRGLYIGTRAQGEAVLAPLLRAIPTATRVFSRSGPFSHINRVIYNLPVALPDVSDLAREDKQSGYIERLLTSKEWTSVVSRFLMSPNQGSFFAIEPYGGAIEKVGLAANAFVHRNVDMSVYVDVFWMSEVQRVQSVQFLNDFMKFMQPYLNGEAYQNYPRETQKDYRRLYWRDAATFDRLLAVKQLCDPSGLFQSPQGITGQPAGPLPPCAPLKYLRRPRP